MKLYHFLKLKSYVNSNISLYDCSIEVMPVNDDDGNLCKYIITVENTNSAES